MIKFPVSRTGIAVEKDSALLDAKWMIDERGILIEYKQRNESTIDRDKYNSLKEKQNIISHNLYAFPVQFNPTEKDLKKSGLREKVDVMIYTAMLDWNIFEIVPKTDIDSTRDSFVLLGETYIIKDMGFVNQFSDTFLNVSFGLVQR